MLLQPLQRVLSRQEASPCSLEKPDPRYETFKRVKVLRHESRHTGGPKEEETNPFLYSFSEHTALLSVITFQHNLNFNPKFSVVSMCSHRCESMIQFELIVHSCDSYIELSQCCLLKGSDMKGSHAPANRRSS